MDHNSYIKEYNKKYLKTKNGFIRRLYTRMQSRIRGSHGPQSVYYVGKELLLRQDFLDWILDQDEFHKMFAEWESSGYLKQYVPTIDRIDSNVGYVLGNMQIISLSENSRRAHEGRSLDSYSPNLSWGQVEEIKSLIGKIKGVEIAKLYGVHPSTVSQIKLKKHWRRL